MPSMFAISHKYIYELIEEYGENVSRCQSSSLLMQHSQSCNDGRSHIKWRRYLKPYAQITASSFGDDEKSSLCAGVLSSYSSNTVQTKLLADRSLYIFMG